MYQFTSVQNCYTINVECSEPVSKIDCIILKYFLSGQMNL
jgi:hypothetical protein